MADRRPTERAMKAAVEMEMHAAVGTRTVDKGATLDKCFPAYDELLAALQEVAGNGDGTGRNPQLMVDAAIAAIAKATGGQ